MPVLGDDERVDLEHLHVLGDEGRVELGHDLLGFLGQGALEAKRLGDGAAVMGHHAGGRIDREGEDLLRRVVGDLLDVHAALGGDHEGDAAGGAVDQHREVELALDVGAVLDIEAVDLLAGLAGLDRHEGLAEHLLRELLHLVDGLGEAHAALLAGLGFLEPALAAAARMDLGLHHPERTAELLGGGLRLVGGEDRDAAGDRQTELLQDGFALVFVDVHLFSSPSCPGWRASTLSRRGSGRRGWPSQGRP